MVGYTDTKALFRILLIFGGLDILEEAFTTVA